MHMAEYRRARVPGGVYFFTVVVDQRRPVFNSEGRVAVLREAVRATRAERPFDIDAFVVLPDHSHCVWRLPEGDADFSGRWREIKKRCTQALAAEVPGRLWQRRFWEHAIRSELDWRRHLDYIHYNPVKHGHARSPAEWPWSSFRACVARGWYASDWGQVEPNGLHGMHAE
jgi:putative transposase